jgi:hypothetical protein
VHRPKK